MPKYVCLVIESGWWEIILPVAYYRVSFLHNLTNFLTWMSINLERAGSLAMTLELSWKYMRIQNHKYFWNTLHFVLFISGGDPSRTKIYFFPRRKHLIISSWLILIVFSSYGPIPGVENDDSQKERESLDKERISCICQNVFSKSGKYEYVFCHWCSKKDTHIVRIST